jgi:hypothetical protein
VSPVAEKYYIPAAQRAHYDQALTEAVDVLLDAAAQRDHLDVVEANVDLMNQLVDLMEPPQLAAAAAALAIRLHRSEATR